MDGWLDYMISKLSQPQLRLGLGAPPPPPLPPTPPTLLLFLLLIIPLPILFPYTLLFLFLLHLLIIYSSSSFSSSPRGNKELFAIECWNIGHLQFGTDRQTDRPIDRQTKQGIEGTCHSLKIVNKKSKQNLQTNLPKIAFSLNRNCWQISDVGCKQLSPCLSGCHSLCPQVLRSDTLDSVYSSSSEYG